MTFRSGHAVFRRAFVAADASFARNSFATTSAPRADGSEDGSGPTPVDYASFSEASVMSRIARRRVRPASGLGRTRPGKSEEDFWLAADAPGYEGDTAKTSKRWPVTTAESTVGAAAPAPAAQAAASAAPPAADAAAKAAAQPATAPTAVTAHSHPSPASFVRVSSARVREGQAERLVRLYQEEAGPMYAACEGCVGARLLLEGGAGGAVSITEWADEGAAAAAGGRADYGRVMRAIASCFEGDPVVTGAPVVVAVGRA